MHLTASHKRTLSHYAGILEAAISPHRSRKRSTLHVQRDEHPRTLVNHRMQFDFTRRYLVATSYIGLLI